MSVQQGNLPLYCLSQWTLLRPPRPQRSLFTTVAISIAIAIIITTARRIGWSCRSVGILQNGSSIRPLILSLGSYRYFIHYSFGSQISPEGYVSRASRKVLQNPYDPVMGIHRIGDASLTDFAISRLILILSMSGVVIRTTGFDCLPLALLYESDTVVSTSSIDE